MQHYWFLEPDPATFLPEGFLPFADAMARIGKAMFPSDWHGEDEFRLRNTEPSSSGGSVQCARDRLATAKIMLAETSLPEASALLNDEAELSNILNQLSQEARQPDIEAQQRYADLVSELRKNLIDGQVVAIGLANDGSEIALTQKYWRGNLAQSVLYDGVCAVDQGAFVSRKLRNSPPTRYVMFDAESVETLISKRSSRIEPKKGEDFELARKWLNQQMRRSPNYRPKPKNEFRKEFNIANDTAISVRRWADVWALCINDAEAPSWSKAGPTKER